jgi:acyl-CoA synthetase (AMP-forming)/AMP-acid ligase II
MPPLPDRRTLWNLTAAAGLSPERFVSDASGGTALAPDPGGSGPTPQIDVLQGRTVLISSDRQLPALIALLLLDGVARRILLCPPDLDPAHLPVIAATTGVDLIVSDGTGPAARAALGVETLDCPTSVPPAGAGTPRGEATEWLLFTSGTTGRPKIVVHTLATLSAPLLDGLAVPGGAIWSTFYDVRRYGGLQILLRGLLGGGSLVLSQADEPVEDFLTRAGRSAVTHISGTPSHWRRALMSGASDRMAPRYVRLSGEPADQAILNNLAHAWPNASVAHAFASTEAGVAFDVRDGKAGFPAAIIGRTGTPVEMRVVEGSLRIRSNRVALGYLGDGGPLADADGFVDTGDMLELRGDRYFFVGRREGVINVGGQKVHPEEVEAVINQHPDVRIARVRGRRSPITGAIVVAEIVIHPRGNFEAISGEILQACRNSLAPHKVPVTLRRVDSLDIAGSGKISRADA